KHPGLGPSHIRDPVGIKALDLIVEKAIFIPHVIESPLQNGAGQRNIVRIEVSQQYQCNDALCDAMNIDGKVAVVEILGGAVISEKVGAVELEAALDVRFKLGCFQAAIDGVKSA